MREIGLIIQLMKCPKCGTEPAEPLFRSVECINPQCENYSETFALEVEAKSIITDKEIDDLFEQAFGNSPFGD